MIHFYQEISYEPIFIYISKNIFSISRYVYFNEYILSLWANSQWADFYVNLYEQIFFCADIYDQFYEQILNKIIFIYIPMSIFSMSRFMSRSMRGYLWSDIYVYFYEQIFIFLYLWADFYVYIYVYFYERIFVSISMSRYLCLFLWADIYAYFYTQMFYEPFLDSITMSRFSLIRYLSLWTYSYNMSISMSRFLCLFQGKLEWEIYCRYTSWLLGERWRLFVFCLPYVGPTNGLALRLCLCTEPGTSDEPWRWPREPVALCWTPAFSYWPIQGNISHGGGSRILEKKGAPQK
jgi:hypothetical protein